MSQDDLYREALKNHPDKYFVEEIRGHTGDFKKKSTVKFTVKWKGYEQTTSEPWSTMRNNLFVHQYLRKIGKEKEIPKCILPDNQEH